MCSSDLVLLLLVAAAYMQIAQGDPIIDRLPSASAANAQSIVARALIVELPEPMPKSSYRRLSRAIAWAPLCGRYYADRAEVTLLVGRSRRDALLDFRRARTLVPSYRTYSAREARFWLLHHPPYAIMAWRDALARQILEQHRVELFGRMLTQVKNHPQIKPQVLALGRSYPELRLHLVRIAGKEEFESMRRQMVADGTLEKLAQRSTDPKIGEAEAQRAASDLQTILLRWHKIDDRPALIRYLNENPASMRAGWIFRALDLDAQGRRREAWELMTTHHPRPKGANFSTGKSSEALQRAWRHDRTDPVPGIALAIRRMEDRDGKAAQSILRQVVKLPNAPHYARYLLAEVYAQRGDYDAAWEEFLRYYGRI